MMVNDQVRLVAAVSFVVILAIAGTGVYGFATSPPIILLLPADTILTGSEMIYHWNATFTVPSPGGRLVGSWTAFGSSVGLYPLLFVDASSVPGGGCYGNPPPGQSNETGWSAYWPPVDEHVNPGVHTAYWFRCPLADRIVITQTVQIVLGSAA